MRTFYLFLTVLFVVFNARVSAQTVPDTNRINAIMRASLELLNSDQDSAYKLAEEGYRLSQQAGFERGIGKAFMRFGAVLEGKGRIDSAVYYYQQALQIREKMPDLVSASGSCLALSNIYQGIGKKDSAFYYLFYALRMANSTKDSTQIASTFIELGSLFAAYHEPRKALLCLQAAFDYFARYNDLFNLIRATSAMGDHYFQLEHFNTALPYFLKCAQLSKFSGNQISLAASYNNAALCYDRLEQYDKAKYYYHLVMQYYRENEMKADMAMIGYNLGNLYSETHMPDSAIWYTQFSATLARSINNPRRAMLCYKQLAKTFADKGHYLKAYEYHIQYTQLSDSLLNNEKVKQIAEMETRYKTEVKEQEIVLLGEQNKTKAAQRNFFIAGTVVLMLAILILGIVYLNKQKLALKNEQIAQQQINELLKGQELKTYNAMIEGQEEERKRIATDLHDRLGSMLSTVKLLFSSLDTKIDKAQENNQQQFDKAGSLLDEAVMEVRRISHNLSTGMVMSFGLVPALQELCSSIDNSRLIQCKLLAYGMNERLDQQTEIELYRMVQEVFSNILKHAKAKQVTIQLNRVADSLNITIEDNGVGFDVVEKRRNGGLGLKNIEARAARLNGSYHIDSQPGRGTISIIEIPITQHIL